MRRNVVGSSGSPRFRKKKKREEDKEERENKRAC